MTVILVIAGYAPASWLLAVSCVLIVVGALVASFGPAGRGAEPKATQTSRIRVS